MNKLKATVQDFARMVYDLVKSDRDVNTGVGGFTGEGKTTLMIQIMKEYAKISKTHWGFDRMTWSRKELMTWIDGEKESVKDSVTGLKKRQLPEYSSMLADELFLMFYARNWFESDQIDAIATFNMCRDRHLFLGGNVPDFWDLDSGFRKRIRFYIYIPHRGVAWVFQQENNPFSSDPWNVNENKTTFRKSKTPYKCPNFICEILFDDITPEEKEAYLKIRNTKRVTAIDDNKSVKMERYADIKEQRSKMIQLITTYSVAVHDSIKDNPFIVQRLKDKGYEGVFTNVYLAELLGIDDETIRKDKYGKV